MNKIIYTLLFSLSVYNGYAQQNEYYYQNSVYKGDIRTVQLFREGDELSNPVIHLGGNDRLLLKFDDLSGEVKNYYYTIIHCDAGWNESFILQNEYLDGFPDNPVDDYHLSLNTTFSYVHYQVEIPNDKVQLKLSGNYVIVVYEDNDKDKKVLSKRFSVEEPLTGIEATVRKATLDAYKGENQEVDFTIYLQNLQVENPVQDIKVVLEQNNRWDNAIKNLKPQYVRGNTLIYDYDKENVFPGGNEFRYFDIRTIRNPGEGVFRIDFERPYYHVTLIPDAPRTGKKFNYYKAMNGNYVVESQDQSVQNPDLECDYVFVHFSLDLPSILLGGTVNVFGALSDWNANKSNEMTWNFQDGRYELTMLLKEGYYNYQYAWVEKGSPTADLTNIEGSYWEANNNYQIYVYYHGISDRYDRLVGFQQFSINR